MGIPKKGRGSKFAKLKPSEDNYFVAFPNPIYEDIDMTQIAEYIERKHKTSQNSDCKVRVHQDKYSGQITGLTVRSSYFGPKELSTVVQEITNRTSNIIKLEDTTVDNALLTHALSPLNPNVVNTSTEDLVKAKKQIEDLESELLTTRNQEDDTALKLNALKQLVASTIENKTGVQIPDETLRNYNEYMDTFRTYFEGVMSGEITEESNLERQLANMNKLAPAFTEGLIAKLLPAFKETVSESSAAFFDEVKRPMRARLQKIRKDKEKSSYVGETPELTSVEGKALTKGHISERHVIEMLYAIEPNHKNYELLYETAFSNFNYLRSTNQFKRNVEWNNFDREEHSGEAYYSGSRVKEFIQGHKKIVTLDDKSTVEVTKQFSIPLKIEYNQEGNVLQDSETYANTHLVQIAAIIPTGVYEAEQGVALYGREFNISFPDMRKQIGANKRVGLEIDVFDFVLRGENKSTTFYRAGELHQVARRRAETVKNK